MSAFKPLSTWLLVEQVPPVKETQGGIALSDGYQRNENCVVVLASGPGLSLRQGLHSVQWAEPGDVVLVPPYGLWQGGPYEGTAFVRDCDLLARLDGDEVIPMNDWVWIDPDPAEMVTAGGIHLSEDWTRPRGKSGVVRSFGPGRLRTRGEMYGTRKSVEAIMGGVPLVPGNRVWWSRYSDAMAVGRHSLSGILVPAGSLIAMEGVS